MKRKNLCTLNEMKNYCIYFEDCLSTYIYKNKLRTKLNEDGSLVMSRGKKVSVSLLHHKMSNEPFLDSFYCQAANVQIYFENNFDQSSI